MKRFHRLVALAAAAISSAVSAHGSAFCPTRTCDPAGGTCKIENGCNMSGNQLFWPNSCVSFDVQKDGSARRGIDYDTLHRVAERSFQLWLDADCGNGQHPGIQIFDYGPIDCAKPEYNKTEPNANVITFHDSPWLYTNTADTVALTTVFFNGDTGEIYDANVEINSDMYGFADGNPVGAQVDLNAVLAHELGHFLGLSHSNVQTATMWQSYNADMATLAPDDVQGICLALAPDRATASNECTPRHGFSGECGKPQTGCCATALGSSASTEQSLGLFAFGLGWCAWRGRLRLRRSKRSSSARGPRR